MSHDISPLSNKQVVKITDRVNSSEPSNILSQISASHKNRQLSTLLCNARLVGTKNNILTFAVKDDFTRETLIRNYFLVIKKSLTNIDSRIKMVSIVVENRVNKECNIRTNSVFSNNSDGRHRLENNIFSKPNAKFIFDNYITGESNVIGYKVTKDIALQNINYNHSNVFYIHSKVGMGKTHLLQSIVNKVHKDDTINRYKVGYLSAESFMHNFIKAVKSNTLFDLREKIKEIDLFLIDDLEFMCGKESTQKEFSYILNALIESGKKIVLASSVPCHILRFYDERTESILRSSNTIYIEQCDYGLRLKVLKYYNKNNNSRFNEHILELIARKITSNIRELEAGFNNLKNYLDMSGKRNTEEIVHKYIQHYIKTSVPRK